MAGHVEPGAYVSTLNAFVGGSIDMRSTCAMQVPVMNAPGAFSLFDGEHAGVVPAAGGVHVDCAIERDTASPVQRELE